MNKPNYFSYIYESLLTLETFCVKMVELMPAKERRLLDFIGNIPRHPPATGDPRSFKESFSTLGGYEELLKGFPFSPPKLPLKCQVGETITCDETDILAHYIGSLIGQLTGTFYREEGLDNVSRTNLSLYEKRLYIVTYLCGFCIRAFRWAHVTICARQN